jgi:hypothetical protein
MYNESLGPGAAQSLHSSATHNTQQHTTHRRKDERPNAVMGENLTLNLGTEIQPQCKMSLFLSSRNSCATVAQRVLVLDGR